MAYTALVTGGARGIGAGIVEKLAQEKWNVVFCDLGEEPDYAARCAELEKKYGVKAMYVKCNITDGAAREAMMKKIVDRFGELNALINNAGVAPNVRADLLDATEESFDRLIGINLKGPYFLTQLVGRHMTEQRAKNADFYGVVVNLSSCSSTMASINRGDYCLSKAAISMATKLWAVRLAEIGVNVYEIRPGIIKTDMTATVTEKYDKLIAAGVTLQPRWGFPEDIGKAVAMLVRGDIAYSTGQVIDISGGLEIGRL